MVGCCHQVVGKVRKWGIGERGKTDLLGLLGLGTALSASSLLALALLQEGLGDEDLVLGGDGAVEVSIVCPEESRRHETIRRV